MISVFYVEAYVEIHMRAPFILNAVVWSPSLFSRSHGRGLEWGSDSGPRGFEEHSPIFSFATRLGGGSMFEGYFC